MAMEVSSTTRRFKVLVCLKAWRHMVTSRLSVNMTVSRTGADLMGEITSITVDEDLASFVRQQVDKGLYASESEVVEDALRLLKESDEASLKELRAAIEEGEASGEPQPFDFDAFIEEKRRRNAAR
ncbi:type II toxin-antitoxin system ParD family antitoxin [Rhizobium sp. 0TCS1.26]|uniref:type II toxin-antitoxin system ParD family antitoxin n=1 Tax=Rhizobium sp. 0TCS1.26 TaxID=3142623 RepID=UPI003D2C9DB4